MGHQDGELVEVFGVIKKDRENAILLDDGEYQAWLPKSLIEIDDDDSEDVVTVTLPEWLAIEKDLV